MKFKTRLILFSIFLYVLPFVSCASAEGVFSSASDRLTICSQNLERYGSWPVFSTNNPGISNEDYEEKQKELVQRFQSAHCDVIAVQELLGKNEKEAVEGARSLSKAMQDRLGRSFDFVVGETFDRFIRTAFFFANDRIELKSKEFLADVELPKLSSHQKVQYFLRVPFQIEAKPKWSTKRYTGTVKIATFHLKSKSGGRNDPTGFQWEITRMESAEKLREFLLTNDKSSFDPNGPILIALGDRNSEPETASAKILEGIISLSAFQENGPCQLSKKSRPLCSTAPLQKQKLFSVLTSDPDTRNLPGTHHYKKSMSWLDDILMPKESLRYALEKPSSEGDYESGVIDEPKEASDHALVFVRLAL